MENLKIEEEQEVWICTWKRTVTVFPQMEFTVALKVVNASCNLSTKDEIF